MSFQALSISLFSLLFIISSCSENQIVSEDVIDSLSEESIYVPFNIAMEINEGINDDYNLLVNVDLDSGCFFISPYESDEFKGHFGIDFDENENIKKTDSLIEIPKAVDEYYVWADGNALMQKGKSSYIQNIKILNQDDFEVSGSVSFTVEPNCNLFLTRFIISSHSGEIEIEQMKTVIDNSRFDTEE